MKCKICSSPTVVQSADYLPMKVPSGFPLRGDLKLAICPSCGFVFNDSASIESDYAKYYSELNKHHRREGALKDLDINYFNGLLEFLADRAGFTIAGASILDYGSGALLFSELALEKGAKHATNYDIGKPKVAGKHNLVVSTHCFEHIYNPGAAFEDLTESAEEGGLICIAVPDLERYHEAYYGPYAHFDLEHINHFSKSSLQRMFELHGIDLVAVRQSDRLVTPTLAYSEVLIVGRKGKSQNIESVPAPSGHNAVEIVEALLERSSHDMQLMINAFKTVIKTAHDEGKRVIGIYGLASYAFRFIAALESQGLLKHIDFYADSDSRLSRYTLANRPIFDKSGFQLYLDSQMSREMTVHVMVAAINGFRIKEMFDYEFDSDHIVVKLLPPDCQNRKG